MKLLFSLPAPLIRQLNGETAEYCIPCDIDEDGRFCDDAFAVLTAARLIIFKGEQIRFSCALCELDSLAAAGMINCGLLVADQGGQKRIIARYSAKNTVRFSYFARAFSVLKKGETYRIESPEPELICEKCGHAVPGTGVCPRCEDRFVGLHRFIALCRPYAPKFLLVSLLMVVTTIATLVMQYVQRWFIDGVLVPASGTRSVVLTFFALLVLVAAVTVAAQILRDYFSALLGARVSMDLRRRLFEKLQTLSLSYQDSRKPGDLMNRITGDTAQIREFMEFTFSYMCNFVLTFFSALVVMFIMNWRLALIDMAFMPPVILFNRLFRRKTRVLFHSQRRKSDRLNSHLQDVLQGIRVVKTFGREESEAAAFEADAHDVAETETRNETFWAVFQPCMVMLLNFGLFAGYLFGGREALMGHMSIGQIAQFISYSGLILGPLGWMTNLPRRISSMKVSLSRIDDVMAQTPEITDDACPVDHEINGEITFDDVTFGYRSSEPVLEHVGFTAAPGEMIGLVGESGSGKSTLINLIMRLYDTDDGRVLIDGTDIRRFSARALHEQIGVVLQDTFLFSGTILDNIRFSRPDATRQEVILAAKTAGAHDFICKFANGYDTLVGERGQRLSGGERQRIAIARAVLGQPRLLILDEATSSLDTESEYLIQNAFERLRKGRTTFAIAHRLSTLKNADRLIVIDNHTIAEIGTHAELLRKNGIYKGLVEAQLQMHAMREEAPEGPPGSPPGPPPA